MREKIWELDHSYDVLWWIGRLEKINGGAENNTRYSIRTTGVCFRKGVNRLEKARFDNEQSLNDTSYKWLFIVGIIIYVYFQIQSSSGAIYKKIIPIDSDPHETLRQIYAIFVRLKHVVLSSWYTSILLFVTKITDKSRMLCRQYAQHTTYAIDETMHLWKLPIIKNREVTKSQKTIGLENPFAPVVQLFIGRVRYLET